MNNKLSALIDGDLDEQSVRLMVDSLNRDDALRKDWGVYCLIGDAIRGEYQGSPDLASRVMAGLDDEPTVLAPRASVNEPLRRSLWQSLMPIAASVMGVAAVGLVAATMYSDDAVVAPVASIQRVTAQPAIQSVSAPVAVSANDAHREYVFVHQSMTGGGPMPAAVQYVRTVSTLQQEGVR
ncbi:MAG: sigma-E factor negative regulatory protein [Azoarcus sp.]|nr:sigma-E factor negative regulatory protein [Azoarcus sp.]